MQKKKNSRRDIYYTNGHDWIDFQGSIAYIGAGMAKLKKIPEVLQLEVVDNAGVARRGEVVMRIECEGATIPVHMPVDGKIISINEILLEGNYKLLVEQPENKGWVALIVPTKPYERTGLMQPEQYKHFMKQNSR
jgi:glycine cleavage system H protein